MIEAGVSRAPGRVNLIGDHTDYNRLPVLPMAIGQSVAVHFQARQDARVVLDSGWSGFPQANCLLQDPVPMAPAGDWRNYVHATAQAVAAEAARLGVPSLHGLDGTVTGDVPLAAGLSSSSALVVAVGNALLAVNGMELSAMDRMRLFARAERYVGTEGGGMDQAASIGGSRGHALLIRFAPLYVVEVPIPDDWSFLVVATPESAEKSGGVRDAYNYRVRLCATAMDEVAASLGETLDYPELLDRMGVEEALEIGRSLLAGDALDFYTHTVSEAGRVELAVEAMRAGDLLGMAHLMTASHASLRDRYGVSTPGLEAAVQAFLRAGASGARLTGAGFGGSVVALCEAPKMEGIQRTVDGQTRGEGALRGARVFEVFPSTGARVTPA